MSKWKVFEYIFHVICFFSMTGLVGYWTFKFHLDDDLSVVAYKQYDMKGAHEGVYSPYLSQTMCFRSPFITSKETHMNSSEKLRMERYLSGKHDLEYPNFNYNNVALNLTDYVKQYYIRWRNGTFQSFSVSKIPWKILHNGFNGFWLGRFFRCFTLKQPSSDIVVLSMRIENDVHNQGRFSS